MTEKEKERYRYKNLHCPYYEKCIRGFTTMCGMKELEDCWMYRLSQKLGVWLRDYPDWQKSKEFQEHKKQCYLTCE